jgi:chromosome segregation ATPase
MSDIVERLRALRTPYEHPAKVHAEAADEIERLRSDLKGAQDRWHLACDDIDRRDKRIERLQGELAGWETMRESYYHLETLLGEKDKRIEELEKAERFGGKLRTTGAYEKVQREWCKIQGGHHITEAQIDAMVEYANDENAALPGGCQGCAWDVLNMAYIVRCEVCNGVETIACTGCNGHGWKIGGEDE